MSNVVRDDGRAVHTHYPWRGELVAVTIDEARNPAIRARIWVLARKLTHIAAVILSFGIVGRTHDPSARMQPLYKQTIP